MKSQTKTCPYFNNFKFPLTGWIILIHELLERFSFYGMKCILTLYLNLYLGFDEDKSTILYHIFSGFSYLSPIFGAIIADNYLGRFKTILVVGVVYLIGHILMPLTAIQRNIPGPLIGMCIIAIGAGGIKSSVAAFGGDQLSPGNDAMVEKFFSLFYTSINLGAFMAQFVIPILRSDVSCVDNYCYPLAFGVPALAFLITYLIFLSGIRQYNIVPRSKNVLSKFVNCVYTAVVRYFKHRKQLQYKTVMDYARPDYTDDFIHDCTIVLRIMIIFTPIPIFWALYDQQGSRWTLQAKNMDGRIGRTYTMKPDQIQAFNALLIIVLIPVFDFLIYPVCNKLNMLRKPTSKLITSYTVAAISFIIAGILQIYIVKGQSIDFSELGSKFSIINTVENCQLTDFRPNNNVKLDFGQSGIYNIEKGLNRLSISCNNVTKFNFNVTFREHQMKSAVVFFDNNTQSLGLTLKDVSVQRQDGFGYVRLISTQSSSSNERINLERESVNYNITESYANVPVGKYNVICSNTLTQARKCGIIDVTPGSVGSLSVTLMGKLVYLKEFEPRLIHMLWQLPQYVLITGAEILCSITALSFAYSQSPDSMKSLMQAMYLLTIFGGNIIVAVVAAVGKQISQTGELFLFASLALLAGFINWILIRKFWNSNKESESNNDGEEVM